MTILPAEEGQLEERPEALLPAMPGPKEEASWVEKWPGLQPPTKPGPLKPYRHKARIAPGMEALVDEILRDR